MSSVPFSALADAAAGRRASHVPYRDSVLTKLLQPALGGNSRTTLVNDFPRPSGRSLRFLPTHHQPGTLHLQGTRPIPPPELFPLQRSTYLSNGAF